MDDLMTGINVPSGTGGVGGGQPQHSQLSAQGVYDPTGGAAASAPTSTSDDILSALDQVNNAFGHLGESSSGSAANAQAAPPAASAKAALGQLRMLSPHLSLRATAHSRAATDSSPHLSPRATAHSRAATDSSPHPSPRATAHSRAATDSSQHLSLQRSMTWAIPVMITSTIRAVQITVSAVHPTEIHLLLSSRQATAVHRAATDSSPQAMVLSRAATADRLRAMEPTRADTAAMITDTTPIRTTTPMTPW